MRGESLILHLVTDRRRLYHGSIESGRPLSCLLRQVQHAIDAGLDVVQIRERDLEAATLAALVSDAVALAKGTTTRVVVNDRLDVALAAGAAGVHLPANSMPPAAARRIAPPGFMIGCSVHDAHEAARMKDDADYLIAGTVWATSSKGSDAPLLGLAGLAAIVRAAAVPVVAIGGVTLERVEEVKACGAVGIAAIGLFIGSPQDGCGAVRLVHTVEVARTRFDRGVAG